MKTAILQKRNLFLAAGATGVALMLIALGAMVEIANAQTVPTTSSTSTTSTTNSSGGYTLTAATTTAPTVGLPLVPDVTVSSVVSTPLPTTTTTTVVPTTNTSVPSFTGGAGSVLPAPAILTVDVSGNILLRGTVVSIGNSTLAVNSWGGVWTINTATAQITNDASGIAVGDFVGVSGVLGSNANWTVNAAVVRDWTSTPGSVAASGSAPSGNTSSVPAGDTLYTGTATDISNIGSNSFVLTDAGGITHTVTVASDATVWDSARADMPLSSIAQNDSINIDGTEQSDGSINADVVRDTNQ